jgi:predicted RNase H-like HicB family nuclease
VPDLPGCVAAAGSYEDTLALIREAIPLHIEVMREHGEAVPEPSTRCDYAEVAA